MIEYFQNLHPVLQALIATCFTWFLTALGASGVFLRNSGRNGMADFRPNCNVKWKKIENEWMKYFSVVIRELRMELGKATGMIE